MNHGFFFGALEGTRIPGPLIKSQMLYRLSYERIHYKAQYNTILPNNITILPGKMQAFCTKNFPKAVIGQILHELPLYKPGKNQYNQSSSLQNCNRPAGRTSAPGKPIR